MKLAGATVMVTGAGRGLGKALVTLLLARHVEQVYAAARRPDVVRQTFAAAGDRVTAIGLDITNPDAIAAAATEASDVSVLINNAAVAAFTLPMEADPARVAKEMNTNYFGTFAMMRAFAPVIGANGGGAIVNVLSMSALASIPSMSGYSASKAASHSMTQAMRSELRPMGIAVLGAYPGGITTDMLAAPHLPSTPPEIVAEGVLRGLEAGDDYIFPCPSSQGGAKVFFEDPRQLERALEGINR